MRLDLCSLGAACATREIGRFIGLGAVIGRLAERITDLAYPSDNRPRE